MFSWFVGVFFSVLGHLHSCLYIDDISGTEVAKLKKCVLLTV